MTPRLARLSACLAGACLLFLADAASAIDKSGVLNVPTGSGGVIQFTGGGVPILRTFTGASSGEVGVFEQFKGTNPGGANWTGGVNRSFPWASVAKGAVAAARILAPVAAALAIAEVLESVHCQVSASGSGGPPSWGCSAESAPQSVTATEYRAGINGNNQGGSWYPTPAAACSGAPADNGYGSPGMVGSNCRQYHLTIPGAYRDLGFENRQATHLSCPSGYTLSGSLCYSMTETIPATEEQVSAKVEGSASAKARAADMLRDAVAGGATVPEVAPATITGPATTSGPSKVVTGPAGVTTTTTTYGHTYNTTNNTYNYTTTTSVTNPAGETETTTEEPPVDECTKNPGSLMCAKLDSVADEPFEPESRNVAITPAASFGADNASCPAPAVFSVHGQSITMSYQLYCDYATGLRPIVLALAWLGAAFLFMGAVRPGD